MMFVISSMYNNSDTSWQKIIPFSPRTTFMLDIHKSFSHHSSHHFATHHTHHTHHTSTGGGIIPITR
jgi:hypothetical protein